MPLSRLLLLIFVVACVGVAAELLLLEHFEDWQQWVPLVLLGAGVGTASWHARGRTVPARKALAVALALMGASGVVGQVLHFRGNMEFELEADPSIGWGRLMADSLMGATPALAPGTMVLLAAIGYAYLRADRVRG